MNRRIERVNHLLAEEIADLLRREIQDPRLNTLVSVTGVETSPDLHNAIVNVSIMGDEEDVRRSMDALKHASGFLRHELGARVRLKYIPVLTFRQDTSIEQGAHLLRLLKEINEHHDENPEE